jgi:hypothetical protein
VSKKTPGGGYRLPEPSRASRKIARASRGHFNGHVVAGDGPGRIIRTESNLELLVLLALLMRPEIVDVVEQLPAIRYIDMNGIRREHVFDYLATRIDGTRVAIAVKPWKHAQRSDFVARLKCVARDMPIGFADRVQLITDRHLDPIDKHNAELLHAVRHADAEADEAAALAIASIVEAMRLEDLAALVGLAGRGMRALLRLVRDGRLRLVSRECISEKSFVTKVEIN